MADSARDRQGDAGLIGGTFEINFGTRLPELGGGLAAFGAADRKGIQNDLMAVQVRRNAPARSQALAALTLATVPGLVSPVGHGPGRAPDGEAYFVICRAPPGAPVGTAAAIHRRWTEAELLACVLRPAAAALAKLQALRVTHRAIRPDNVFQPGPLQPVTLGAAWAAPPASLQPAVFEAPHSAWCLPAGRGEGSTADDVYALGVLLLALAAGALPMAGMAEAEVVRRKLAAGSYAALSAGLSVPPVIADLVSGMVATDPNHRLSPLQLLEPTVARNRRVSAAPARRAARPLEVDGNPAWDASSLAGLLSAAPQKAAQLLKTGAVDRWVRRILGDVPLSLELEEAMRVRGVDANYGESRADAVLVTRVVALLDPFAPVCWRGLALWPDGLGPALAAASPEQSDKLEELIEAEAVLAWAAANPDRNDPLVLRADSRQHRAVLQKRAWYGGVAVLRYALNPLLACRSLVLGGRIVSRITDLLPALEGVAAEADRRPELPLDAESAAFISARETLGLDRELAGAAASGPGLAAMAQLRALARMQLRLHADPTPQLGTWLAEAVRPLLAHYRSVSRRGRMETALADRAAEGNLSRLVDLLDDPIVRAQDEQEAEAAREAIGRIDAALAQLDARRADHAEAARHIAHEVAGALGVIALSAAVAVLALG